MKRILVLMIGLFLMVQGFAQDSKGVEFNVGADLMSRYVWRGTQFGGASPSLQPSVSLTTNNFEIGFWGAYSLGGVNPYQEFDLYMSYTFAKGLFTATVTDYFFPEDGGKYDYFDYKEESTGHILEGSLCFNGTEKFPISILLAMNFHGADAKKIVDDPNSSNFNEEDGIQYSTYVELGYSCSLKDVNFDVFAGINLTKPEEANLSTGYLGEAGFYGSKAGVVNLGFTASKEVGITDKFLLPVSASVIANPVAETVFFVFGISL